MNKVFTNGFFLFLLLFAGLELEAQNPEFFEIKASALLNDKGATDYSILVYTDGQLKDSVFCKKSKSFSIPLLSNKVHSIVFRKDGFQEKVVIVNTYIPVGVKDISEDPFELQVELSSITAKPDLEDHPVAILMINKKKKTLMASEDYYQLTHN